MREIKFRAWDKKNKKMRLVAQIDFECFTKEKYRLLGNGWRYKNKDNTILMQYTGLKDKNGKEIYEGDILKVINFRGVASGIYMKMDKDITNYKVEFGNARFTLVGINEENESYPDLDVNDSYKIIGNVFENPELLKL